MDKETSKNHNFPVELLQVHILGFDCKCKFHSNSLRIDQRTVERCGRSDYRMDERPDEVRDRTGRRHSFRENQEATGVSVSVLSDMPDRVGYVTTTRTIDALCGYSDCQPGELITWRANTEDGRGETGESEGRTGRTGLT